MHEQVSVTGEDERTIAEQVSSIARLRLSGCTIRFGRTHKVDKRFLGTARGVEWKGPCKRRGGAFVIICDYGKLVHEEHKTVLMSMMQDYSEYLLELKLAGARPMKKRRKAYPVCRNRTINASNDLEFLLDGQWYSFGTYMPSDVRELKSPSVTHWLEKHRITNSIPSSNNAWSSGGPVSIPNNTTTWSSGEPVPATNNTVTWSSAGPVVPAPNYTTTWLSEAAVIPYNNTTTTWSSGEPVPVTDNITDLLPRNWSQPNLPPPIVATLPPLPSWSGTATLAPELKQCFETLDRNICENQTSYETAEQRLARYRLDGSYNILVKHLRGAGILETILQSGLAAMEREILQEDPTSFTGNTFHPTLY